MTVKDLRRMLTLVPDDATVIVAKDAEGNGFKPLDNLEAGNFERAGGQGHFISEDEMREDQVSFPFNAVCLWPN